MHDDYPKYIEPAFIVGEINGEEQKLAQKKIYNDHFPFISKLLIATKSKIIQKNPQEIFNQSFIVLSQKAIEENFKLNSCLKSYLWAISWRILFKSVTEIEKTGLNEYPDDWNEERFFSEIDPVIRKTTIKKIVENTLTNLDEPCKKLLESWAKEKEYEEILKLFPSLESIEGAKHQTKAALLRFIRKVKNNPLY